MSLGSKTGKDAVDIVSGACYDYKVWIYRLESFFFYSQKKKKATSGADLVL
jgi:hypothetical protein